MKNGKFFESNFDDAVSPVVGVMLMLVVTIIIAAVVSGFAGGVMTSSDKVPQATIKGTFSISDGLRITHTGGDSLPMHKIVFTIYDGETFGPDVATITKQTLNVACMTYTTSDGKRENVMGLTSASYNKSSFSAGDSLYIDERNCAPDLLQPSMVPSDYTYNEAHSYDGSSTNRWSLCLQNIESIGKDFVLTISDTSGNLIAKTTVAVTT